MKNNIGIVGIGQAGGNIGYLLEQKGFDVIYINSSKGDLDTINTDNSKKYHIQNGLGCAKDRLSAKNLIKEDYKNILDKIQNKFSNKVFIYLIFSTGGGTGSGSSPILAKFLLEHLAKNVGVITILPSEKDTLQAHINSFECFQEISKLENIGGSFVIDNNTEKNILVINERFASLFNKIFDYKKYETKKGNIDEAEILKLLNTKGMIVLGKCKKEESTQKLINNIKNGIFATLENDSKIKYLGIFNSIKFDTDIFKREIGTYIDKFENVSSEGTLAILSGLTLPFTRILKMRDKIQNEKEIIERFSKEENPLEDLDLEFLNGVKTEEKKEILSNYVGFGGLSQIFEKEENIKSTFVQKKATELREMLTEEEYEKARASTLNAHYTPDEIIKNMYSAILKFGFKDGVKILEPSCGTGNFIGHLPEELKNSKMVGVEIDSITGRIAKQLYPQANIKINGFEKEKFLENSFDLVVGNVPFGEYSIYDKKYNKNNYVIHDYFIKKVYN